MFIATVSDKIGHRFIFALIPQAVALTGFAILYNVHHNANLQYAALFLAAAGTYSSMPVIVCWFATNCKRVPSSIEAKLTSVAVGGHSRRAVGTGWQVGFGNSALFHFARGFMLC